MYRSLLQTMAIALLLIAANSAQAVMVPTGLSVGDTYQLAFVTAGTQDATSSDIDTYNTFVQTQADMAGSLAAGATWNVIGSTNDDDANVNAFVSGPVYLLDGTTKIADDFVDMWDGSLDFAINIDQFGVSIPAGFVVTFTGTDSDGTAADFTPRYLGASSVRNGLANNTNFRWIQDGAADNDFPLQRFYALSTVLTVVPEPMSVSLVASGALALLWRRRRR